MTIERALTILRHIRSSPIPRKRRCSQKLLVGVLFVHVLLFEILSGQLFNQYPGSGQELGFCVVGVEHESVVLQRGKPEFIVVARGTHPVSIEHSPSSVHADSSDEAGLAS